MRVPRRWQWILSLAAITVGLAVYACDAKAGPIHDRAAQALNTQAGARIVFDCTYSARGALALAQPAYRGLPARVYARPELCQAVNSYARSREPTVFSALALLVLTHEAAHIAGVADETEATRWAWQRLEQVANKTARGSGRRTVTLAEAAAAGLGRCGA